MSNILEQIIESLENDKITLGVIAGSFTLLFFIAFTLPWITAVLDSATPKILLSIDMVLQKYRDPVAFQVASFAIMSMTTIGATTFLWLLRPTKTP